MIGTLLRHEMLALYRNRRLQLLGGIAVVLLLVSGIAGDRSVRAAATERARAVAQTRAEWLAQGPVNPHNAAHFGSFAFKPVGALAMLDGGVDPFVGTLIRLEAHAQNDVQYTAASQQSALVRLGALDPALVLLLLVPLVLIVVGHATIAGERESGRLQVMVVQGATRSALFWTKTAALWGLGLCFLVLVALQTLAVAAWTGGGVDSPALERVAALMGVYAGWLLAVSLTVTIVSALAQDARAALTGLLLLWIGAAIVAPRIAGRLAADRNPLPTRRAFQAAMRADREKGLNGHDPQDARVKALEAQVLVQYGVTNKKDLPINFDGISLQKDEEYGDAVWDRHSGALEQKLDAQRSNLHRVVILNPAMAVRALSMALAGTDVSHARHFQQQAETYRRDLIQRLNHEQAYGGSRTDDWDWKASTAFIAGIPDFVYVPPSLDEAVARVSTPLRALVAWTLLLTVIGAATGARLRLERA